MNTLSILIYLAGVSADLGGVTFALAIVCSLLAVPLAIIHLIGTIESQEKLLSIAKPNLKKAVIGAISFLLLSSFIPSAQTMYMIAASEMGEEVINTEEIQLLREIIVTELENYIE